MNLQIKVQDIEISRELAEVAEDVLGTEVNTWDTVDDLLQRILLELKALKNDS